MMQLAEKHRKEYDSFGPWMWEIKNNDDIPDLFLNDFTYSDSIEIAFKIPRNVERRDTRPGADLYDCIVAIYVDSVLILQRVNTHVERREVMRRDILAVGRFSDLLYGEFFLYLPDTTISIPFNTVSENIIAIAIHLLRASHLDGSRSAPDGNEEQSGELSILFQNLLQYARKEESLRFLAHQRPIRVIRQKNHWYDYILSWFPRRIQESLFLAASQELILIQRIPQIVYDLNDRFGYMQTYIPFCNVTAIERVQNPVYQGIDTLSLCFGNQKLIAQVERHFLGSAGQALTALIPVRENLY